jgi:hypothetical protein
VIEAKRANAGLISASILLVLALGSPTTGAAAKPDQATTALLGDWLGLVDTGEGAAKLRLALHLGKNPDGTLNGSIDSLDEKVKGIPVEKPIFADGKLSLNVPTIGVFCELTPAPNRVELRGTWRKHAVSFPVAFKKETAPAAAQRHGS